MEFKAIIYEIKDNVAWITLNRPEKLNAQNDLLRLEFIRALNLARDDREAYVIVITGAGHKAFSAGADVEIFDSLCTIDALDKFKSDVSLAPTIRSIIKPTIAMVNGLALGGGFEMAMSCDMIFASENARFGLPEVKVGIIPGAGGTQMLTKLVGEKKAKELIFTSDFITAKEAEKFGLINKAVPESSLRQTVEEVIGKLRANSPAILRIAKLAVNKALETPLSVGSQIERELVAMCFGTEDQKEGLRAFMEKRPANYKGR